jgi:hypothetical protein
MIEFTISTISTAPAEAVLAGARDFSPRRIDVWPNVSAKGYEVHAAGETFTEVTEAALQGFVWERSRYEWSDLAGVRQTVLDSNALRPGSTWELTVTPNGGGCYVEAVFRREFTRGPKGRFAFLVNRFGQRLYLWDLRRALAEIERGVRSGAPARRADTRAGGHPNDVELERGVLRLREERALLGAAALAPAGSLQP